MEFIPRPALTPPAVAAADARRRLYREIGVAAVAAVLGMTEGGSADASSPAPVDSRMPIPQWAA